MKLVSLRKKGFKEILKCHVTSHDFHQLNNQIHIIIVVVQVPRNSLCIYFQNQ